jgi:Bacterial protein of unknown function (DUF899)
LNRSLRGIDMVNGAYQVLDLVPKGRDEDGFDFSMEWYAGTINIERTVGQPSLSPLVGGATAEPSSASSWNGMHPEVWTWR